MPRLDIKAQGELGTFLRQYQRKAEAGWDPNDRSYDRAFERRVKGMRPEELDALMHDDAGAELSQEVEAEWLEGAMPDGVMFALGSPVVVSAGRHSGESGIIVLLVALNPEPVFLVEIFVAALCRLNQSSLVAGET
jgi:hypothetical protein